MPAHGREPHLDQAARSRHRPQLGRDGRQALEPRAARLARRRFRGEPVRPEAPGRHDREVAGVPDAGGGADGRTAGARLRVPRPGNPPPQRRAVRRRDWIDHRRVEHLHAARRSDAATAAPGGTATSPATGRVPLGVVRAADPLGRTPAIAPVAPLPAAVRAPVAPRTDTEPVTSGVYAPRLPRRLDAVDPRARPPDSRPGDIGPRAGSDDAAGARAGERRRS